MPTISMLDIGNSLKLRDAVDPNHRITNHIRSSLSTIDLIPVDYILNFGLVGHGQMAISYDFQNPIKVFQAMCSNYGLPATYGGVRCWLTDETQATEEFTHSFENNIISDAINKLSGKARALQQILKSTGSASAFAQIANRGPEYIGGAVGSAVYGAASMFTNDAAGDSASLANLLADAAQTVAKTAASVVLQGKMVSLPKVWSASSYNSSFTLTIKLVSPYGSPKAIKEFIIKPLMYLLLLVAPKSNDGLSYGLFQPLRIKGYGLTNINLGSVEGISIRRGGKETAYNVFKQPLVLDVSVSIIPLCDGFAAMEPSSPGDVAIFSDADKPFNENPTDTPSFTTVGNVIQSLRPAPDDVVNQTGFSSANVSPTSSSYLAELGVGSVESIKSPAQSSSSASQALNR